MKKIAIFFILFNVVLSFAQQTPYNGPHNIPGTIEAEDFDEGGQDVSYHDNELGKHPSATVSNYRNADGTKNLDVEILSASASNDNKIGWTNAGDWLEYTFNATATDDYIIKVTATARNAAAGQNKGYQLFIDGNDISGKVNVNPTKDWFSEWIELSTETNITQGEHVLRLEIYSEHGHALDLDKIQFVSKTVASQQELSVNPLISNNAIFQRDTNATVWGKGEAGNVVTIEPSWNSETTTTTVGDDGKWSVKVPTTGAGGPYTLKISDPTKSFNYQNIMLGEVWLCAGQSNMDQPLLGWGNVEGDEQEVANSDFPNIRMFTIQRTASYDPLEEVVGGFWRISSPAQSRHFSAVGYFFAKELHTTLNVPVGILTAARGDSDAESWTTANSIVDVPGYENILADLEAARATPDSGPLKITHFNDPSQGFRTPGGLYNGLIAPILPYTIKGAAWYQGESNSGTPQKYTQILTALIDTWRVKFDNPDMPFYYAQIAPLNSSNDLPAFRESQFLAKNVSNTGMAVLLDLGEQFDIHPRFKKGVGQRLAYWALNKNYAQNIVPSGPIYKGSDFKDGKAILSFDYSEGLKLASDGDAKFEIAGSDGVFKAATATIVNGTLEVSSNQVANPVHVRYAWENWIERGTLRNGADLPSSSFQTDDAVLFSNTYVIDQEKKTIDVGDNGSSITVAQLISNLSTVPNASFKVLDASGNPITTGNLSEEYSVESISDNGEGQRKYALIFGIAVIDTSEQFTLQSTGETCASSDNGKLKITATNQGDYAVTLSGEGIQKNEDFTMSKTLEDLKAGTYDVTINDKSSSKDYVYSIIISEPPALKVGAEVGTAKKNIILSLEGSKSYYINYNGKDYTTSQSKFSLALKAGENTISVKTDKECQGVFHKTVHIDAIEVYPNPVVEQLYVRVNEVTSNNISIAILDVSGKLVLSKTTKIENGQIAIDMNAIASGLYFLQVPNGNSVSVFKVLKK